jgi:hypothetical protein
MRDPRDTRRSLPTQAVRIVWPSRPYRLAAIAVPFDPGGCKGDVITIASYTEPARTAAQRKPLTT